MKDAFSADGAMAALRRCYSTEEIAAWFTAHAEAIAQHLELPYAPNHFSLNWLEPIRGTGRWKFHLWMASPDGDCCEFLENALPRLGFEILWRAFGTRYASGSDCFVAFNGTDFPLLTFCETLKQ